MSILVYRIELTSDAEPGTGLSTEFLDDTLPRDARGRPVLRGSHVKGLMRQRLGDIAGAVATLEPLSRELESRCFGRPGEGGDDGVVSRVRVHDAVAEDKPEAIVVPRTAIDDLGTAGALTLRMSEAVPVGTVFNGKLEVDDERGGAIDLAVRLALLSVEAVGGGRNRGAGACVVSLEGEKRGPGQLLRALVDVLDRQGLAAAVEPRELAPRRLEPGPRVWLRLVFRAEDPVCCPEHPLTPGINVIESGFAIPSSAVQGALLTRLSSLDDALASACFADPDFRAWPLLPTDDGGASSPVRVSLSHRMSKLPRGLEHDFRDSLVQAFDWREVPAGSPLKAADGVLLGGGETVRLWRSADMPRVLSAHGVHSGDRNLFTVEAMAPLTWSGFVSLPAEAAEALERSIAKDPRVSFGKARTVRGGGALSMSRIDASVLVESRLPAELARRVFVAQSPLALPDDWGVETAEDALRRLVSAAGWGEVAEGSCKANVGVRFGWNRRGLGARVGGNRLRARRCVLPGSAFVLDRPIDDLESRLRGGLGEGREAGFGAVLPHPGIATKLYRPQPEVAKLRGSAGARGAKKLIEESKGGVSRSQAGEVRAKLAISKDAALNYLEDRRTRSHRVWSRWRGLLDGLTEVIREAPLSEAREVIETWHDVVVAKERGGDR